MAAATSARLPGSGISRQTIYRYRPKAEYRGLIRARLPPGDACIALSRLPRPVPPAEAGLWAFTTLGQNHQVAGLSEGA